MSDQPLISILVPVFNTESFLDECLKSISIQTFENFEVIVSDDCSSDKSVLIAKEWARNDSRIKVFEHDSNVRMTKNWNRALGYASGKYVTKLDSDDAYGPRTLEEMLLGIGSNQAQVSFVRTLECDDDLRIKNSYRGERAFLLAGIDPSTDVTLPSNFWYQHCFYDMQVWHSNSFLISASLLRSMNGWNDLYGCASDTDLILRILEIDTPIAHRAYPGVLYRLRQGSVSDNFKRNDALADEGYSVALSSLDRSYNSKSKLRYRTLLNWYRIYDNARHRHQERPSELLAKINKPPVFVRVLGSTQRWLYKVKETIFSMLRKQPPSTSDKA